MQIITSENYVINPSFFEVGSQSQVRSASDTDSAQMYLLRSRVNGADIQSGDVLGNVIFNGVISSADQQFARVQTYFDGTGGVMEFQAASDTSSTLATGLIVDGANQVVNLEFFTASTEDIFAKKAVRFKAAPNADEVAGNVVNLSNGDGFTIAMGTPVFINSNGNIEAADATDDTTAPAMGLARWDIANTDPTGHVLLDGVAQVTTLAPAWTVGGKIYLAVGGGFTQTPPATGIVQVLGVALGADTIRFKPELATNYGTTIDKFATIDNVDVTTVADIPLYTVPTGKAFIPTQIIFRCTSFVDGGKTVEPTVAFGITNPDYNDYFFGNIAGAAVDFWTARDINQTGDGGFGYPLAVGGTTLYLQVDIASDATTEEWSVDLFGYLIDA